MTLQDKDLSEYDSAAEWCAKRGLVGGILPPLISASVVDAIDEDREAFYERVRGYAYAMAMEAHQ